MHEYIDATKVSAIVIGAQKCGTSALWQVLTRHPDIVCHDAGQFPRFYDAKSPEAELKKALLDNYGNKTIEGKTLVLRDTTISLEANRIPEILNYFPNARVILMVRDHIERCRSAFVYAGNKGFETEYKNFDGVLDDWEGGRYKPRFPPLLNYIEAGFYTEIIERVLKAVPKERVIVLRAEDLKSHQRRTCSALFSFLGVADHSIPLLVVNVTGDSRFPLFNKFMRSDGALKKILRKVLTKNLRLKLVSVFGKLNTKSTSTASGLSESQKDRLASIYSADRHALKYSFNIEYTNSSGQRRATESS